MQDSNSTDIVLRANNFSAWYGEFQALHNITMNVPAKNVTALIGPSGCGKSTFLRWINRMNDMIPIAHCDGELEIENKSILHKSIDVVALRRRVGMVFQKPNPFPKSIYDNVAFGPNLHYRLTRKQKDEIVEKSLTDAALWDEVKDRLKDSALGLSGGQQQRLCIARALAVSPDLILMDEPASALDPRASAKIESLISQLKEDYTILIVTHNMQQAARVSQQTAFFYEGELIELSDTEQMFTNPTKEKTEDYISGRFG